MLLNVVLTPDKPIPKSTFRNGAWCELWVLLPLLPQWGPEPGEKSFYQAQAQGENRPSRRVPGAPSSGTPWESHTNFRVGTVWGL